MMPSAASFPIRFLMLTLINKLICIKIFGLLELPEQKAVEWALQNLTY